MMVYFEIDGNARYIICDKKDMILSEFSTKPSLWLYGRCYTIKVYTIDDFQKATPIIEAFGGSTERFLLKSADVRLTKMDELIKAHLELEQVDNLLSSEAIYRHNNVSF